MTGNWFGELLGGKQTLDAIGNALIAAKEWQGLLAGLLVLIASLIVARAIRKAAMATVSKPTSVDDVPADMRLEPSMRLEPRPFVFSDTSGDLIGELEQLRSLIRSALSAFTLTAEK